MVLPDGRIECRLCPRFCKLGEGQRGFCFVRQRVGDRMVWYEEPEEVEHGRG